MRYVVGIPGRLAVLGVVLGALLAPALAEAQQQQAGVTAAVRGRVEIAAAAGAVGRVARSGEPVYLGNAVKSGADAGLQILLLDQTTFTIGPDSELVIDQFVYDPNGGSGKVSATVAKGVFRFVTGQVARNNPADMVVKMPIGTIGIRGTIAMGSVTPATGQSPAVQEVALLGPGRDRDSKDRKGAILLSGPGGNVNLDQAGYGSTLGKDGAGWAEATRWSTERLAELQARLVKTGGQTTGLGEPGQASRNAETQPFDSRGAAQLASLIGGAVDFYDKVRADSSQDGRRPASGSLGQVAMPSGNSILPPAVILDGPSTREQLRSVPSGQFYYQGAAGLTSGGSYTVALNIDFGGRFVGGGNSAAVFSDSFFNGRVNLGQQFFTTGSGVATFPYANLTGVSGVGCQAGCRVNLTFGPQNLGGVVGATATHNATVNALVNFGGGQVPVTIATGQGTAARSPGVAP